MQSHLERSDVDAGDQRRIAGPRPSSRRCASATIAAASALLLGSAGLIAVSSGPVAAATPATSLVVVKSAADTYVSFTRGATAHGRSSQLRVSKIAGHIQHTYLRYQIPKLTGKAIVSARLMLTTTSHHPTGTVIAHTVPAKKWSETTLTSRSVPGLGATLSVARTSRTKTVLAMDVTKALRRGALVTIGLSSTSTNGFAAFRSRESGWGTPRLRITLRPSPAPDSNPTKPPVTAPGASCVSDPKGLPTAGAYVGAAAGGSADGHTTDIPSLERAAAATMPLDRTYYVAHQVDWAITSVKADLAAGRLPWISFKMPLSWADMAAGKGDAWVIDLADKLAAVGGPVWLAFHHEPETDGPIADWVAMQRHLAPIIHAHAKNVAYTVILTAYATLRGDDTFSLRTMWPGDGLIDVLGFDMYNLYGMPSANGSPSTAMTDPMFYFGPYAAWARAHHIPWAVGETGITRVAAQKDPNWLATEYRELVANGGIALAYFDSPLNSTVDWTLSDPVRVKAFKDLLPKSVRWCGRR